MKYEQAIKTLRGIKTSIIEKATKEFNSAVRLSYNGTELKTHDGINAYAVNFITQKISITFGRVYCENSFIGFMELTKEDFQKILNTVRTEDLIQEFNIWFKSVLALNKDKLLL